MSLRDCIYGSSNELLKFTANQPPVPESCIPKCISRFQNKSNLNFWKIVSNSIVHELIEVLRKHILAP